MRSSLSGVLFLLVLAGIVVGGCHSAPPQLASGRTLPGHTDSVFCLAFQPGGTLLASAGADQQLLLWDYRTGKLLKEINAHGDKIFSVTFSPDGHLIATGSADRMIKIWDAGDFSLVATARGHKDSIYDLAFSPDGAFLASASADLSVRVWDTDTFSQQGVFTGHRGGVQKVLFTADSLEMLSFSSDRTIKRWDLLEGYEVDNLRFFTGQVLSATFFTGETLLVGSSDGMIYQVDLYTDKPLSKFKAHTMKIAGETKGARIWGLQVASGKDIFFSCAEDKRLKIWKPGALRESGHISFPVKPWALQLDSSGEVLAVGLDSGEIRLYRVNNR